MEMTRVIRHVMRSHMEYKCIFMWALEWYLLCCSHADVTTCTETGILGSSDKAISIWMVVGFGQLTLPRNVLSAKKVKVSMTRCKTQTSLRVFSSYSTSWLKMYQAPQLWTSSSIRMHEIKTSRSTELRNCQGKKTHKQTNEKTGFKKNWITCEISIILSPVFPHSDRNCKRSARSKVASGKWITK